MRPGRNKAQLGSGWSFETEFTVERGNCIGKRARPRSGITQAMHSICCIAQR